MVYRPTERTEARKAAVRDRILREGIAQVTESGFSSLNMIDLADRANVATGTVYRHFASKSHLSVEIFETCTERELAKVREALTARGDRTIAQRFNDASRVFAERALRGRQLARALISEPVDPELDSARLKYRGVWAQMYQPILAEGIESGELPEQSATVSSAAIVGALAEVLVGPLSPNPSQEEIHEVTEQMIAFGLRAVGAPYLPPPTGEPGTANVHQLPERN